MVTQLAAFVRPCTPTFNASRAFIPLWIVQIAKLQSEPNFSLQFSELTSILTPLFWFASKTNQALVWGRPRAVSEIRKNEPLARVQSAGIDAPLSHNRWSGA